MTDPIAPERGGQPVQAVVDARGLRCPLPVIRLGFALRELGPGAAALLLATDPAARSDVAAFCRMRGHELVEVREHRPPGEPAYAAYLVRRMTREEALAMEGAPATGEVPPDAGPP